MIADETTVIRAAFTASIFADPYRARDAVLEEVAASTGLPLERVEQALPSPGSPAWVAEFSPTRTLLPLEWDRDVSDLRAAITGPQDGRWPAMRVLLSSTVASDESRTLLLDIIRGTDTYLRISAIESGWRHFDGRATLREALREIIRAEGNESVRVAAIRRIGMDVDRDPRSVTTLMAALGEGDPIAVRVAATEALATVARGYPRAIGLVARGLSDDDVSIRVSSYKAVCTLVDDETERRLLESIVRAMAQHELVVGAFAALNELQHRRPDMMRSVLPLLEDPTPEIRRAAVELSSLLTRSDDEHTVRMVMLAGGDPAVEVRAAAEVFASRMRARNSPPDLGSLWRGTHGPLSPEVEALLA